MDPTDEDGAETPTGLRRLREVFWPAAGAGENAELQSPDAILPPERRKQAMAGLDAREVKLTFGALILSGVAGIVIPAFITAENKVTTRGRNSIAVAPDAWLLGGVLLLLTVVGLVVLWRRKRTFVAFDLFFIGFGFTLFVGFTGFVFILLGGWLMLRAWRINRYGTTNSKTIARETAARRTKGRGASAKAGTGTATPSTPGPRTPPTASKRYTPKSAPKKKIPKPTQ